MADDDFLWLDERGWIGANRRRSSTAIAASEGTIRPRGTCASAVACLWLEDVLIDLSSAGEPASPAARLDAASGGTGADQERLAQPFFAQRAAAANDRSNRDAAERLSAAPLCVRKVAIPLWAGYPVMVNSLARAV